jgi:hypothetical protein
VHWVQDASCNPTIPEVEIPSTGDDTFDNTINELSKLGYNRPDRKYILWTDSEVYCGIATIYQDDDPEATNISNGLYPNYGRIDYGCWNYAEGHELMHNLGGVQTTAPNATIHNHCTDESDEMCYADDLGVVMRNICPNVAQAPLEQSVLFDCNHDDYFYAGTPPSGSYLATHWNIATSSFLTGGGVPPVFVQCNNRTDDDVDGKTDYPDDPGCSSSTDTSEADSSIPPGEDKTAPTTSITQPKPNAILKSSLRKVGIYANGYDQGGVKTLEIYIDNDLKKTITNSSTYISTNINYTWDISRITKKSYTILVKARDVAGNVAQNSITVTVTK